MRVAVLGPQNTGKSTFIQDFLQEFHHYTSPKETYRDVVTKKGLVINQLSNLESQREIRNFMFTQFRHNTEYNIIFDRCLIDNYVYTCIQHQAGTIPKWFVDETEAMMKDTLQAVDMYLFIPTAVSVPLVDDGTRDIDKEYIDTVNNYFLKILFDLAQRYHITVKVISGNRSTRIQEVRKLL